MMTNKSVDTYLLTGGNYTKNNIVLSSLICCSGVKYVKDEKPYTVYLQDEQRNDTIENIIEYFEDMQKAFPELELKIIPKVDIYDHLDKKDYLNAVSLFNEDNINLKKEINNINKLFKEALNQYLDGGGYLKIYGIPEQLFSGEKMTLTTYNHYHRITRKVFDKFKVKIDIVDIKNNYLSNFLYSIKIGSYTRTDNFINIKAGYKGVNTHLVEALAKQGLLDKIIRYFVKPGIIIENNLDTVNLPAYSHSFGGSTNQPTYTYKLLIWQFMRFTWANLYDKYLPLYFKIKKALPDIDFMEIMSMVNLLAHEDSYYCPFPNGQNGLISINEINERRHLQEYFNSTNQLTRKVIKYRSTSEIIREIKLGNYKKAYEFLQFGCNGAGFDYKVTPKSTMSNIFKSKNLTIGKHYDLIEASATNYKIRSDDYIERWYSKFRFDEIRDGVVSNKEVKPKEVIPKKTTPKNVKVNYSRKVRKQMSYRKKVNNMKKQVQTKKQCQYG